MENRKFWNVVLIVWISLQIIALMISNCTWEKGMYFPKEFFPFSGYPDYFYAREKTVLKLLKMTYSYSEFFVYSIPAFIILYLRNRRNANFESEPIQFIPVEPKVGLVPNQSNPGLVTIKTRTQGLTVSMVVTTNGIGVTKSIGRTPLTLNRYTFNGCRLVISGSNKNVDFYMKDQNEYYFDI